MMKRLVLTGLILTASLVGQEIKHAPTVAQCQADQRLWFAQLEEGDSPKLPTQDVLAKWNNEMSDCQKVDPGNTPMYYNTGAEIDAAMETRLTHFILRHGLWSQFMDEDTAGKR
jgi:hypothetical protein